MRSSPAQRYMIQSQTTPQMQHSCRISSSSPSSSCYRLSNPTSTSTSLLSTPWAASAFLADISREIRKLRGMLLCSITPELSVVFRTIRGVRMPCDCLPSPSPTLKPNFCIILRAICSFSSGSHSSLSSGCAQESGSSASSSESELAKVASCDAQVCLVSSQELGCCGSYYISTTLRCSSRFSFSTSEEMAALMLIFLAESMLLSLELRLASVIFFLPTSSLGQVRTGSALATSGLLSMLVLVVMELMKLLSFFSSSALSFFYSNLGTGGGRLGRSICDIMLIIVQQWEIRRMIGQQQGKSINNKESPFSISTSCCWR